MKILLKTIALAATLVGLASCGSNPDPGGQPPVSYQDPGIVVPAGGGK